VSDLFPLLAQRLKVAYERRAHVVSGPVRYLHRDVGRRERPDWKLGDARFELRQRVDWLWYFWLALHCIDPWRQ
jgi:hypothetical protein